MNRSTKRTFHGYISFKGLKSTRQRDIILDAFLSAEQHISNEELYQKLRAKHPNIGYSTVYRALRLFVESGIAREIWFGDGQTRYEHVVDGAHHDHLVCTRCRAVTDFESEAIETLQSQIASCYGFFVETHKLELYGLCSGCRQ
ncbi:Fur family transcriptional regulator [Geobacter sp. DSM 9736]|uniref:Fur family transcriptional regulator n=1 Tax=Geobacter sp. DSM 9736 TaxID=1277350 RepID=UPI000B514AF1|nr:transcriptional repressor [Geobacter sp. DSM 9736]